MRPPTLPDPAARSLGSRGLLVAQAGGAAPAVIVDGSSPGESGVAVVHSRFAGSAHWSGTALDHVINFNLGMPTRCYCRMADRKHDHIAPPGAMAIRPARMDVAFDSEGGVEALSLFVSAERLSLAAAQGSRLGAALPERLSGRDPALQRLAETLAAEAATGYGNGPLYWNGVADEIIEHLVERHLTQPARPTRGGLSAEALGRLTEFIHDHLDQPIGVDALAGVAAQSRFHFSRMFARSVGMSPYRYVVQLRLERALALLRDGRQPMSEIAQRTGFADQSHLTRWMRRIYGVPPGKLRA